MASPDHQPTADGPLVLGDGPFPQDVVDPVSAARTVSPVVAILGGESLPTPEELAARFTALTGVGVDASTPRDSLADILATIDAAVDRHAAAVSELPESRPMPVRPPAPIARVGAEDRPLGHEPAANPIVPGGPVTLDPVPSVVEPVAVDTVTVAPVAPPVLGADLAESVPPTRSPDLDAGADRTRDTLGPWHGMAAVTLPEQSDVDPWAESGSSVAPVPEITVDPWGSATADTTEQEATAATAFLAGFDGPGDPTVVSGERSVVAPPTSSLTDQIAALAARSPVEQTVDPAPERSVDVPSGRDWDAEIERSAGLAPLIERGFAGTSGARRPNDPLWAETVPPRAEPTVGAAWAPAPSMEVPVAVPHVPATPTDDGTGEIIDLLEMGDIVPAGDPMAVPLRPQASPVLAEIPEDGATEPAARRRRRGRRSAPTLAVAPTRPPRRNRHLVRRTMSWLVVLAGLAGLAVGGYLAVDEFVLAKRWPVSLQPVSTFIEERTGLAYDHSVAVSEVPADEFRALVSEVRLGVPITASDTPVADVMAPSRALGLWSGAYAPEKAARVAARAWPALYDPATDTVYVDESVTDNDRRKAAVARELALALFDQQYGWSDALAERGGGERMAYRVQLETEAMVVASAWLAELAGKGVPSDEIPEVMRLPEVEDAAWSAVPDGHEIGVRVPLSGALATATGNVTVLDDFVGSDEELLFGTGDTIEPPALRALADDETIATGIAPQGPQGSIFWLTVLLGRLEAPEAMAALEGYRSDDVRTVLDDADDDGVADRLCVDAALRTSGRAAGDRLLTAFERWAAMAPGPSGTVVTRDGGAVVAVRACDPGLVATTATRPTAAADAMLLVGGAVDRGR